MTQTTTCLCLVICLLRGSTWGVSPPDNSGEQFVVMFMENEQYGTGTFPLELYCTTQEVNDVTVHVTSPKSTSPSIDQTFTVHDGQVEKVTLSGAFRMTGDGTANKGILISASAEVACYGANKESLSNDVFLGLPVDALGTDYFAVCQSPPLKKCEVGVASTQDNTQVKVTLPTGGGDVTFKGVTYHAGDTVTATLQKYETLQVQSVGDLSGAHIETTKPVSAFSGNIKTNIGKGNTSDHLVEQLVPSDRWGKKFVTAPIPARTVGDEFKVIAKEDGTTVTVPGMAPIVLNKGEVGKFELPSNQYTALTSDKPVMLVQFVKSQQSGNEPADPSMMIIPPFEQFGSDYTFSTPEYSHPDYGNSSIYRYQNEFMIVADKADVGGLLLDGKPFPPTTWNDIPGSNLVGAYVTLSKGAHTVRHADPLSTFGGYLYGHAFRESYGFPTGMRLAPIYGNCTKTTSIPGDGIDNDCDNRIDEELCTSDNFNKDDDGDGLHDEDCVKTKPIDGLWAPWGSWSSTCSVTCGDGVSTRTRACDSPKPKFGGQNCTGNSEDHKPCYAGQPCPVDVQTLCAANRRAVVANPLNCAQYFDCSKTSSLGQPHLFECPYPQLFSNASLQCGDFETVSCGRRHEPMAPCEYLANKCNATAVGCLPCDQRHHSCVGTADGKQAISVFTPEYKECKKNRTMTEGKCDIGYFNPQAHRCMPHNPGTLSFYCRGHQGALTAIPNTCAKFYNCSKPGNTMADKTDECHYPDLFSTNTSQCENFTTVDCSLTHRTEPQAPCEYDQYKCDPLNTTCPPCPQVHADCRAQPDGVQPFPGRSWGPEYTQCLLNRTMAQPTCPHGQYFHPVKKNCTDKVTPSEVKDVCKANPSLVFVDDQNCAHFYNCSDQNALLGNYHAECHYPDLFSTTTMKCDNFEKVTCDKRMEPMAPCQYQQNQCAPGNSSCVSCPDRLPSCVGINDGNQSFTGKPWTPAFMSCYKNRTVDTDKCSSGYFHPVQQKCSRDLAPPDAGPYCKANPTAIYPSKDNCAKFINCSAITLGLVSDPVQECHYPDLFSTTTMKCQDFSTVKCDKRIEPKAPCDYDQNKCKVTNTSCVPCVDRLPSCVNLTDGQQPFTGRLWKPDFVLCHSDRTVLPTKTCPHGYFHPVTLNCTDPIARTDAPDYCKANPTAIIPAPDNCAKYINCSSLTAGNTKPFQECSYPDLFSTVSLKCQDFQTVTCDKRYEPKAPCDYDQNKCNATNSSCVPCVDRLPSCVNLTDGQQPFTGRLWKPDYVLCHSDRTILPTKQCAHGYFHPVTLNCTDPVARTDAPVYCKANPTAVIPVPNNCAKFINCSSIGPGNTNPTQECTYPDLFSTVTLKCQDFQTITCDKRYEPKAPCDYDQNKCDATNSSCVPCADRLPSCVNLTDGQQPFTGRLWKPDYVLCNSDRTVLPTKTCPHGYFHPVTLQCTDPVSRTDAPDYCKANPAAILPVPDNCAKYINCSSLKSGNNNPFQECTYPDLFSTTTLKCQDFQTVTCNKRHEPKAPCDYDQNKCDATNSSCVPCVDRLPSCVNLTDGQQPFTGRLWKPDYVLCHSDRTILPTKQCAHGYFHPVTLQCTDPVARTDAPDYCKANPAAILPVPDNCAKYINCSSIRAGNTNPFKECTYPDLFSTATLKCQDFKTVTCNKRHEPKAPCDYDQNKCNATNSACVPCIDRLPSCVNLTDGQQPFTGRLWKPDYVLCHSDRTILPTKTCAHGYFHPVTLNCTDPVARTDAPDYCKANPAAILPVPNNCAKYINCSSLKSGNTNPFQECTYPDLFSTVTMKCQDFQTVTCDKRYEPKAPCDYDQNKCKMTDSSCVPCVDRLPSCVNLTDGQQPFTGRLWQPDFVLCHSDRTVLPTQKCPHGYFHPITLQCTDPVARTDAPDYCKANPVAIVPAPDNCAKYINCSSLGADNTNPFQECSYPDLFSTVSLKCQDFQTVTCDKRYEPQAPCEYDQNSCLPGNQTCPPCPQRLPSCIGKTDGANAFTGRLWTNDYIECYKNRTLATRKCQQGTLFDPIGQGCVDKIPRDKMDSFCRAKPSAIKPDPENCAHYFNCSDNMTPYGHFLEECHYPDLFSVALLKCVPFDTNDCLKRPEPVAPCDYLQNMCNATTSVTPCAPCPDRLPSCAGLPDGNYSFPGRLWKSDYITCYKNRTLGVDVCKVGYFHPALKQCTTSVKEPDAKDYCKSNPSAVVPLDDNCARSINCPQFMYGMSSEPVQECIYPSLFSTTTNACEDFKTVTCDTRNEPQAPCEYTLSMCDKSDPTCSTCPDKYPSCEGLTDGDHAFPSQLWKSQYITCDTNRTVLPTKTCPTGFFHPIKHICEDHITKNDSIPYCHSNPRVTMPDSTNCAKYYDCSRLLRGEAEAIVECQYPDLFSTVAMTCQDFTTVTCNTRPEPQAPCEYDQNLCQPMNNSCEPCSRRLPSCVGLPDREQVAPGYQWTDTYVECYKNRTMDVKHCPNGAVFDPHQLICVSNIRTGDISQFCQANPTAIKPRATNCAQYINCSDPSSALGSYVTECKYPDLFSTTSQTCQPFDTVPCGTRHEPQAPCEYLQNLCNNSSASCLPCDERLPSCVGLPCGNNPSPQHMWQAPYITCDKNRTLDVTKCNKGFFHPNQRKCTESVQKGDLTDYCSSHPTAILPAPDDCAQFYNCSKTSGRMGAFVDECQYPALFSRLTMACGSFRTTFCDTRKEPMAPCQYEMNLCPKANLSCTPCPQRLPSCVNFNDGPNTHPSLMWSSTYIICSMDRTMEVRDCPVGQYFNPRYRQCRSQVNPIDIPDYCAVHPSAIITNPDNCAVFFNCSSPSNLFQTECNYPDLYDVTTKMCSSFENVSCQNRPEPKAPCQYKQNMCPASSNSCVPCDQRLPSCVGLPDGDHALPGREWTDFYVSCYKGRTTDTKQCQNGYFNPLMNACVEKVQKKDIPSFCSVHNGTVLPDPDNCAQYITCPGAGAGSIIPQECQYPDLFSPLTSTCQSFTTVQCDNRTEPKAPCEYAQNHCAIGNLTCSPCSTRLPSCIGQSDGAHQFPGREWTADYIQCNKDRTVSLDTCPAGSIFDPYQSACVSRINKNEVQSFCMYNAGSVKENPDNCAQYFNCSQPTSPLGPFLMECAYPKLFSSATLTCQDFRTVQCGTKMEPKAPCDYLRNLCSSSDPTCKPCGQRLPSCVGLPDGMNPVPARLWTPDYVICDQNRTVSTHQCQSGYFHPTLKACEETVQKLDIVSYCQVHPLDILPDPDSCARYFNCSVPGSSLGVYQRECHYPELFSPTLRACLVFGSVNCQKRPVPTSPCEYIENVCSPNDISCKPCHERFPSCTGKPDGNNPYPGAMWSADYIVCYQNRINSTSKCNPGYFNPRTLRCDIDVPSVDVPSYCQVHPTAVIPDPGSCARYFICSQVVGSAGHAIECTYPDVFSVTSLQCEQFQNVDCGQRHEPMTPCEYTANQCSLGDLTCVPCSSRLPSCVGRQDGLHTFGDQQWSQKYMECQKNRTVNVGQCPPQSFFNPRLNQCVNTIDTVDANSFCQSNPTTIIQHPTNCAQYYDCTAATFGGSILKECRYSDLFDAASLSCTNYTQVQCGARYEPTDPCEYRASQCSSSQVACLPCTQRLPSCSLLADGSHPFPGSLWQQQYILCHDGRLQNVLRCPSSTVFNPVSLQCVNINRLQPTDYKDYCQAYPATVLPDPFDCSRFYPCSGTQSLSVAQSQCTYPYLFSTVTNRCEYFDQVDCGNRHEPTAACDYDHLKCNNTGSGCVPCSVRFPDCTGLPDGDNGVTGMLWSVNYVVCKGNRTLEVKRCFSGVFDPNIRRCSDSVGPQHITDLCYSNPTAVVPHPTNCAQYFDCSQAQSQWGNFMVECGYPLLFDPLTMKCRNYRDVQCGSKTVPISPCDYFQYVCASNNATCVPCDHRLVSCIGLPDGNNMVPSQPWSATYVVCDQQRTTATLTCLSGYFDPVLKKCVDSVTPVDVPQFCGTNPHVVMEDASNCASYINCSAPTFHQECPYPQLYSGTSKTCEDFRSVYCGGRPEPHAPCEYQQNKCSSIDTSCQPCEQRLPSCRGLPDGINGITNMLWTDKYVICDHNRTLTVQRCTTGIFDPASRSCRASITPNNIQDVCSHNPAGRFSDASDCARYFDCMNLPVHQECSYPQLYSTDTNSCQDFLKVACGSRPEPMAPCEYNQNLCPANSINCQPCPERQPSCVRLPDGYNGVPGRLWSSTYIECSNNRTLHVARCANRQVFDPVKKQCVRYVDPAQVPDFCSQNPAAVIPNKNSSAQYFNCSNPSSNLGSPYLEECHYPDLFDQLLLQCRDFESVNPDSRPVPQAPCQYRQNLCQPGSFGCTPCPDRLYSCIDLPDGSNPIEGKTWVPDYVNCYKNRTIGTGHCNTGVFDPHKRQCVVKDNSQLSIGDQCSQDPSRMIAHPGSCSLYYNCSKTVATYGPILPVQLQECKYPDLFSTTYQRCMDFQSVQCDTRHEVKAPCEYLQNHCNPLDVTCSSCPERLPSCIGLPDGDNPIIGHDFKQDYIHCFKDRTLDRTNCPDGVFHPYLRKCVNALNSGDAGTFCKENPTSMIASAENCAKYYKCDQSNRAVSSASRECHYPDLFSTVSQSCLPFTSVNCDQRPEPQAPCEYDQNQCSPSAPTCSPCESRLPSCVGLPEGLNGVIGAQYTDTYLDCHLNRTTDVKHCNKGFFDPGLKICATNINSGNIREYCQSHPKAVVPHPTNCAWLYNCSVNHRTSQSVYPFDVENVQECPYPQLFSSASMSCEDFRSVSCSKQYEPQAPCEYYTNRCDPTQSSCIPCPNRIPSCKTLTDGQHVIKNLVDGQRYLVSCMLNRTLKYEPCSPSLAACNSGQVTTSVPFTIPPPTQRTTTAQNMLPTVCAYNMARVVASPQHCAQYYNCTRTRPPFFFECTYPQLYSEITGRCQEFQSVSCHNRPEYKAPCDYQQNKCAASDPACTPCPERLPSCENLSDGNHSFPHDQSQTRYLTCFLGRTVHVGNCLQGVFDVYLRRCAAFPATTKPTIQPDTTQSYCQLHPNEVIPHASNCAQFYDCHDIYTTSHIVVKECHYPLLFHPILRTCSDFSSVTCGSKYEPKAPCDYYANQCHGGACIPCADRFVSCVGQTDGNHPYPGRPTSYVRCQGNRTIAIETCSSPGQFDVTSGQCKAPSTGSGDVIRDFCSVNPSAVLTIPTNCAQYYSCRNEYTQLGHYRKECIYPQLFDDVTHECKDRALANCGQRPAPQTECNYELYTCFGVGCRSCGQQGTQAYIQPTQAHVVTTPIPTAPPSSGPSCVGKPDGLNPYPGKELTAYYIVCDQGRFIEEGICIVQKILDPYRRICTDPADPAIIDVYCNANPGQTIPSVDNCAQYHTCGTSLSYHDNPLHECPYPQFFSTVESICKPFSSVQCGQKTMPTTPCDYTQNQCSRGDFNCVPCEQREPSCKGLPDGANTNRLAPNSAQYVMCDQGRTVQQKQCSGGMFDPVTRSCQQVIVTDPVSSFCGSNPRGQMAESSNCAQYYSCAMENTQLGHYREECPYPLLYDSLFQRCGDRSTVQCGSRTMPQTFCDYELYQCIGIDCMRCAPRVSSSRQMSPRLAPSANTDVSSTLLCLNKQDGLHQYPGRVSTNTFIECKAGALIREGECPGDSSFSPTARICQ